MATMDDIGTADPLERTPYFRDLRHRYGTRVPLKHAESIARAHGTSVASLAADDGLRVHRGTVAGAAPGDYVTTRGLARALGY